MDQMRAKKNGRLDWIPRLAWVPWIILSLGLIGFFLCSAGCVGPGVLSGVTNDIGDLLDKPAVQATLQNWSARGDVSNPKVTAGMLNAFTVQLDGFIVRGNAAGQAGSRGIDPDVLKRLIELDRQMNPQAYAPDHSADNPAVNPPADPEAPTEPGAANE